MEEDSAGAPESAEEAAALAKYVPKVRTVSAGISIPQAKQVVTAFAEVAVKRCTDALILTGRIRHQMGAR